MTLFESQAQLDWVRARSARRVFSAEFPYHQGLPARHVATEPLVLRDSNHFFTIGPGSEIGVDRVNAITCQPVIAGETVFRNAMASHIWGDSQPELGVIEMELMAGDQIALWQVERWAGRPVNLRWGDPRWETVTGFFGDGKSHILVTQAVVKNFRYARGRVVLEMRPQIALFDLILNSRFKADEAQGVIPASAEAAGEIVPLMFGHVAHAPALLTESATLRHYRGDLISEEVDLEVRDNNVVLTRDVDYVVDPDSSGQWAVIDLDNAIGKITWSGTQHNFFGGSADPKELKHCMRLAFAAAGQENLFNLDSLTSNATLNDAMGGDVINVGLYVDSETPYVNVLQRLADAGGVGWFVGAFVDTGRLNKAIFRRVAPPNAEPARLLDRTRTDASVAFEQPARRGHVDDSGTLVSAAADELRHDYSPDTGEWLGVLLEGDTFNALANSFAPATQTVTLNFTSVAHTLSVVGSGTATLSGGGAGVASQGDPAVFMPTAADVTVTVSGSLHGFQLEETERASAPLDTAINSVSLADLFEADPDRFRPVVGPYTVVLEFTPTATHELVNTSDQGELLTTDEGPMTITGLGAAEVWGAGGSNFAADSARLRHTADGQIELEIVAGGTTQASITGGQVRGGETVRVATRIAPDDVALFVNGQIVGTDSAASLPAVTRVEVGSGFFYGHVRVATVFDGALDDAQLAAASPVGVALDGLFGLPEAAFAFDESHIQDGVDIERASEASTSVAVARRVSWADTGGDAIDPSLPPADKRELRQRHRVKVYSSDAAVSDPPDNRQVVELELVDEASQDIEGMRLARLYSRDRNFFRFTALTGALQVQPGDVVRLAHDAVPFLGPQFDGQGNPITSRAGQVVRGRGVMLRATEEFFPSGRLAGEGWA